MLDDSIVLKNCYYWAKKMMCKNIDFNALVSVGYIVGKPLKDQKLLKDWIHFSMLRYIKDENKNRSMCVNTDDISYINNIAIASSSTTYKSLHDSISSAKLSKNERNVVRYYFFGNMDQNAVAKLLKITQPTVAVHLKNALCKIRKKYMKG